MTSVSINELKKWVGACAPDQALAPNDPRNLDLEHYEWGDEVYNLRGKNTIQKLYKVINYSEGESCNIFSGYPGSGKTTELLRLKRKLEKGGYTVLMADAADYHDLSHPLTIEDMCMILAAAVGDTVAEALGESDKRDGYWRRFKKFLQTEVGLEEGKVRFGFADIKLAVKTGADDGVWNMVRNHLRGSLSSLRRDIHAFMAERLGRLKAQTHSEVVFILDSFEKLRGTETTFNETQESVMRVFHNHLEMLRISNCHTIYSCPPYIWFLAPGANARVNSEPVTLPTLKVHNRDGSRYEPGFEAFKQIAQQRLNVSRLFGDDPGLLEDLIDGSGGHVRTFISMLRELLFEIDPDNLPVKSTTVERLLQSFEDDITRSIRVDGVMLLDKIRSSGEIKQVARDQLYLLAHYMNHRIVLCYQNGSNWFEIHPLIRKDIERRAQQLRDEEGQAKDERE